MKICIVSLHITPYYQKTPGAKYGGAEVQAALLARAFSSAGHDVSLVVAGTGGEHDIPYPTEIAYRAGQGVPGLRFFHPWLTGTLRALERADADVYHQHCAGMVTGITALFCRRNGRVFVYGAGSDTDFSFRSVRIKGLRDKVLYRLGLGLATGIVAQNRQQMELCRRTMDKPVRVIPSGVHPRGGVVAGERDAVIWVGGLRRVKRPDLFIELARRLPEHQFVMIGGGTGTEEEYARGIEHAARGVPNLRLTGWLPHSEVLDHTARALLLVNTSVVEGFPNAYLEAWNHAVPIVSFNDVDDLIRDQGLGAICRDLDDMVSHVDSLLSDDRERDAMGARARSLVEQRFSASVLGPQYVSFYEELLSMKRGG